MGKMWGMKGPRTPSLKMGNYAMESTVDPDPVTALIREASSRKQVVIPTAKTGWRALMGTSTGDEMDREAAALGKEWRENEDVADERED